MVHEVDDEDLASDAGDGALEAVGISKPESGESEQRAAKAQ